MSLALRNPRTRAIIALIALSVLVLAVVLLSAVWHVPVLHMVGSSLSPFAFYRHG